MRRNTDAPSEAAAAPAVPGETKVVVEHENGEEEGGSTAVPTPNEESPDQDWLEDVAVKEKEIVTVSHTSLDNASSPIEEAWIQIDATDETK